MSFEVIDSIFTIKADSIMTVAMAAGVSQSLCKPSN